eukprot:TRINITY_DN1996_c0_g2_i1.p1 TRINITY_DN1996_c0_g2~~TRINITY_DN1996_c0_g2_i1.p1  ORF type:complete len:565 (+),score=122.76 TRINITY_DN1996_c0_g2_i1:195-1889(+)
MESVDASHSSTLNALKELTVSRSISRSRLKEGLSTSAPSQPCLLDSFVSQASTPWSSTSTSSAPSRAPSIQPLTSHKRTRSFVGLLATPRLKAEYCGYTHEGTRYGTLNQDNYSILVPSKENSDYRFTTATEDTTISDVDIKKHADHQHHIPSSSPISGPSSLTSSLNSTPDVDVDDGDDGDSSDNNNNTNNNSNNINSNNMNNNNNNNNTTNNNKRSSRRTSAPALGSIDARSKYKSEPNLVRPDSPHTRARGPHLRLASSRSKKTCRGVFGVYDGHGLCGEVASAIAAETLPQLVMLQKELDSGTLTSHMKEVFLTTHRRIMDYYKNLPDVYQYGDLDTFYRSSIGSFGASFDAYESVSTGVRVAQDFGTTAVMAALYGHSHLVVASSGDSAAVLGRHVAGLPKDAEPVYEAVVLSGAPHNADVVQEQERVERDYPDRTFFVDGYLCPNNELLCDQAIQCTRGLGHKIYEEYGVIPDPDVHVHTLSAERDCMLILGSDGIWEALSPQQAVDIAMRADPPKSAAKKLVNAAMSASKIVRDTDTDLEYDNVDNTTCVVIRFRRD